MRGPDPMEYGWWLASRAAGVVALLCIALSVAIGLAMAGRVSARPALARTLTGLHQQTALGGLVAIAVHGITLLGDKFLDPGLVGISVPFVIDHAQVWTGLGVTGGWLAAILGLTYWLRHRLGPRRWRAAHRATILVYVLAVAHTLGSGTDASEPWMRALVVLTGAPVLFLFVMRVLPAARPRSAGPAFRRVRIAEAVPESASVTSFALVPAGGDPLPPHAPGQFLTVRCAVPGEGTVTRSYSLSSATGTRISVKREGVMSTHLHGLDAGAELEVAGPSGAFVLPEGDGPLVLLSAGIGATPVLAMLDALASRGSERPVWWVHSARCGDDHAFREEVRELIARLPNGRIAVTYTRPGPRDEPGRYHQGVGRLDAGAVLELGMGTGAEFRLCGPDAFVADMTAGLTTAGVDPARIASESFGGPPAARPVPVAGGNGPAVSFSRSGVTTSWNQGFSSLLELAEASSVPAASGCRIGSCHGCSAAVLGGTVSHDPEPLDPPPAGTALLCCARPDGDVVLDV